jgi:DNA mismatch endonuclease (patch repair protein)
MSPEKRSALMSRIKGRDTGPERSLAQALLPLGLTWEGHLKELPGRPDFIFRDHRVVVFVDGDFWHGWRFPRWRRKLSDKWERKIEQNRRRDMRNHRKLRRQGWKVIRIWEHQIEQDMAGCIARIKLVLGQQDPQLTPAQTSPNLPPTAAAQTAMSQSISYIYEE